LLILGEELMECKICGTYCKKLFNVELTRPDFKCSPNIYECSSCGFVFSDLVDNFTDEEYKQFYKYPEYLEYDPIAKREHEENFLNRSVLLFNLAADFMKKTLNKNPKILVYGNGKSKAVKLLLNSGLEAYSYMSETNYGTEITDLSTKKDFFDLVVSTEVAEHFGNPVKEFGQIKDVLKVGGWTVHSTNCKDRVVKNHVGNIGKTLEYMISDVMKNAGHVSFYTKASVDILAKKLNMINRSYEVGDNKIAIGLEKR